MIYRAFGIVVLTLVFETRPGTAFVCAAPASSGCSACCLGKKSPQKLRAVGDDNETLQAEKSSVPVAEKATFSALTERQKGLLVLLSVPFAWGTFEPAVRYVYAIDPPIPAMVFQLSYYLVAAVTLLISASVVGNEENEGDTIDWPLRGGLELGLYLFIGNALQVFGLKTVPSDRAAFLLQLQTIFVPLMEALLARNFLAVSARTWVACAVALMGVAVMGLDSAGQSEMVSISSSLPKLISDAQFSTGDLYIFGASIVYTFHCVRIEGFAKETYAVRLAACKASTEALLSVLFIVGLVLYSQEYDVAVTATSSNPVGAFAINMGHEIVAYGESLFDDFSTRSISVPALLPAAAATLWTGWVTVAYTMYAQSYGQSRIKPTTANLIYTVQPVCTAILAWLLLGESLGTAGYLGGALIGSAVLLVATDDTNTATK